MAQEVDGTVPLKFGTTAISGWEVVSVNEQETGQEIEILDEIGDVATHISNFGKKTVVTLEMIANTGTAMLAVGDTQAYTNHSGTSKTARITAVGNVQTQGDVMRTTVTGVVYPGFTAS